MEVANTSETLDWQNDGTDRTDRCRESVGKLFPKSTQGISIKFGIRSSH
jgi:hypothetical protein